MKAVIKGKHCKPIQIAVRSQLYINYGPLSKEHTLPKYLINRRFPLVDRAPFQKMVSAHGNKIVEEIMPKLDDDPSRASDEMPRDYPKHPCGGSPYQAQVPHICQ